MIRKLRLEPVIGKKQYPLRLIFVVFLFVSVAVSLCKTLEVRRSYYRDALTDNLQDGICSFWTSDSLCDLRYFSVDTFPSIVRSFEEDCPSLLSCILNSPQRLCVTVSNKSVQGPILSNPVSEETAFVFFECDVVEPCFPPSTIAIEFYDCSFKSMMLCSCLELEKVKTISIIGGEFPKNFCLNLNHFPRLENFFLFGRPLTHEMCIELENASSLKFVCLSSVSGVDGGFAQKLTRMTNMKQLDLLNCVDRDGSRLTRIDGGYGCEVRFGQSHQDELAHRK